MSILVEIGGFLGGVLNAYAKKKKWSKFKYFLIVFTSFFVVGFLYILLFPPVKGILVGVLIFGGIAIAVGLVSVLLMILEERFNKKKWGSDE